MLCFLVFSARRIHVLLKLCIQFIPIYQCLGSFYIFFFVIRVLGNLTFCFNLYWTPYLTKHWIWIESRANEEYFIRYIILYIDFDYRITNFNILKKYLGIHYVYDVLSIAQLALYVMLIFGKYIIPSYKSILL